MKGSVVAGLLITIPLWCNPAFPDHQLTPTISLGGRIKVDAVYSSESISGTHLSKADLALSPSSIPITDLHGSATEFNLRESRLWGTLRIPLFQNELSAYTEIDFFDTARDNLGRSRLMAVPRFRHAYASLGNFTLGKTYTSFINISAFPEINDANGPVGVLVVRQPMLRYKRAFSRGEFRFSLEKPETTLTDSNARRIRPDDESAPDIAARLTYESEKGNVSLAGMIRKIEADRTRAGTTDDEQWGVAVSVAGRWRVFDRDNIRFTLSWGNTLGRYLSYNVFGDAAIDDRGNIDLTEILGGHVAYQHWWSHTIRSNLVAGLATANHAEHIVPASRSEQLASTHLNLIWSPKPELTVGIEWLYAWRRLIDERSGRLNRIQFSAIYKF